MCGVLMAPAPSEAGSDDVNFVSAGIAISYGTRGWAFGVEISAGVPLVEPPAYVGTAIGFDVAPSSDTWGRLYLEAEAGALIFGAGAGPAWLFGGPERGAHVQLTPYFAVGKVECEDVEPFLVIAPFYRYTSRRERDGLHEIGVFTKGLALLNGRRDHGICFH